MNRVLYKLGQFDWPTYHIPEPPVCFKLPSGKSLSPDDMESLLGDVVWKRLQASDDYKALKDGSWSKREGLRLLLRILDAGESADEKLFRLGMIPPLPGHIRAYTMQVLNDRGSIPPDGKIHYFLRSMLKDDHLSPEEKARLFF